MSTATATTGPQPRRRPPLLADPKAKAEARTRRWHRGSAVYDSLAFLVPLAMAYQVEIIGRLYAAEFLLLLMLPLLLIDRGGMLLESLPKTVLALACAWFASQVLTDIVDGTPYADWSRGWSKIFFFIVNFAVIYMLIYGNRRRIVLFAIGLALGLAVSNNRYANFEMVASPWKFMYGFSATLALVAAIQFRAIRRVPMLPVLLMIGVGALNMYMGWRSMAGVCFLAAMYLMAQAVFGKKGGQVTPPTNTRLAVIFVLGVVAAWFVLFVYEMAAMDGLLGADARDKLIAQTSSGAGILLGGRHEVLVSLQAILDSPILGHGSWAQDRRYVDMLVAMTRAADEEIQASWFGDLIPTHSHLTGAWVEAGLLGGVFWLFILFLVGRVLANLFQTRDPLAPLAAWIGLLMIWDILFSPFAADRRVIVPFEIVLMMFVWDSLKVHAERARQIRRIRRAAHKALKRRGGARGIGAPAPRPGRPLPSPRLMRRPPPNVATLPRPSARAALQRQSQSQPEPQPEPETRPEMPGDEPAKA